MPDVATSIHLLAAPGLVADVVAHVLASARIEVQRGAEGASSWASDRPDLALVVVDDLDDPVSTLGQCNASGATVLALTEQAGVATVRALVQAGATSVLACDSPPTLLLAAVALSASGISVLEESAATGILAEWRSSVAARDCGATGSGADLTTRELDVLQALAEGLASKGAARRLGISLKTVESHKANLFKKLGVRTQAQAVAVAIQAGLVEDTGGAGSPAQASMRSQPP